MVASPESNGKVTETYVEVVERCKLALPGHPSEWLVVLVLQYFSPPPRQHNLATNTLLIIHVSTIVGGQPVSLVRLKPVTGKNVE